MSGAAFLLVVILVERLLPYKPMVRWMKPAKPGEAVVIFASVTISFTCGMLLENISARIFDHIPVLFRSAATIRTIAFAGEGRVAKVPKFLTEYENNAKQFVQGLRDGDSKVNEAWAKMAALDKNTANKESALNESEKERVALAVYYGVVNKVELDAQSSAASEIRAIRDKYRFLRSIGLSCLIGLMYYFLGSSWQLANTFLGDGGRRRTQWLVIFTVLIWLTLPWFDYVKFGEPIEKLGKQDREWNDVLQAWEEGFVLMFTFVCFVGLVGTCWRCLYLRLTTNEQRETFIRHHMPTLAFLLALVFLTSFGYEGEVRSHARRVLGYGLELFDKTSSGRTDRSGRLNRNYSLAVADAKVVETTDLADDLIDIGKGKTVLLWWISESKAKKISCGEYKPKDVAWTVVRGELKAKLGLLGNNAGEDPNLCNAPDLKTFVQRMKKVIGLPLVAEKGVFLHVEVELDDVFRPAANPDPREYASSNNNLRLNRAQLKNQLDYLGSTQIEEKSPMDWYQSWFTSHRKLSYKRAVDRLPYPWTGLGYTFDWRQSPNGGLRKFGLTEICIIPGSTVEVIKRTSNQELFDRVRRKRP